MRERRCCAALKSSGVSALEGEHALHTVTRVCVCNVGSACDARKASLEMEIDLTNVKLRRAEQLLASVGGERERWLRQGDGKMSLLNTLPGDVFLASAVIAYLGPFVDSYRAEALAAWASMTEVRRVPTAVPFDMAAVVGDAVQIRGWNLAGECCCARRRYTHVVMFTHKHLHTKFSSVDTLPRVCGAT